MAVDLETLSPKELQALIADAQSKMRAAHANLIQDVRKKMDALLSISGLTLAEVYPTRGGNKAAGKKGNTGSVAPKYRDPSDPSKTWSGRGHRPLWFVDALKRRGVTAESLLIAGASKAMAPASSARTILATATSICPRCTASTSFSAIFIT